MNTFFTTMGEEWINILYTIISEFVLLHEVSITTTGINNIFREVL